MYEKLYDYGYVIERERERERETETERETGTETETERDRERQRQRERKRNICRYLETWDNLCAQRYWYNSHGLNFNLNFSDLCTRKCGLFVHTTTRPQHSVPYASSQWQLTEDGCYGWLYWWGQSCRFQCRIRRQVFPGVECTSCQPTLNTRSKHTKLTSRPARLSFAWLGFLNSVLDSVFDRHWLGVACKRSTSCYDRTVHELYLRQWLKVRQEVAVEHMNLCITKPSP